MVSPQFIAAIITIVINIILSSSSGSSFSPSTISPSNNKAFSLKFISLLQKIKTILWFFIRITKLLCDYFSCMENKEKENEDNANYPHSTTQLRND